MRVGIVGAGGIGRKRAAHLAGCTLVGICDAIPERAAQLATTHPSATVTADCAALLVRPDVDIIVVATTHNTLAPIAARAATAGKHVLIEKPGAMRAAELDAVSAAASRSGVQIRVGYNHRYHPALQKARQIFDSGAAGDPLYVRARYGHGGRIGYETEWRANPTMSGGGEAIDQGVHLIDLARWFLGDFQRIRGCAPTYFWNMPVEDNAFFLLETSSGQVASLHASWTEWKNLFSFELFCRHAKLEITGLGGSYGIERLSHYRMMPGLGPPETTIYEYPQPDDSWDVEFKEFVEDIRLRRPSRPGVADAQAVLRVVEDIYTEERA